MSEFIKIETPYRYVIKQCSLFYTLSETRFFEGCCVDCLSNRRKRLSIYLDIDKLINEKIMLAESIVIVREIFCTFFRPISRKSSFHVSAVFEP